MLPHKAPTPVTRRDALCRIGNGFGMLNGNPNWQQASVGIVLIAAVGIDALRTYRERR